MILFIYCFHCIRHRFIFVVIIFKDEIKRGKPINNMYFVRSLVVLCKCSLVELTSKVAQQQKITIRISQTLLV